MDLVNIIIIGIILSLLISIGVFMFLVIRNEIKKKKWIKIIKPGDTCKIVTISDTTVLNKCKITKVSDDDVTVELTLSKRWIYPTK